MCLRRKMTVMSTCNYNLNFKFCRVQTHKQRKKKNNNKKQWQTLAHICLNNESHKTCPLQKKIFSFSFSLWDTPEPTELFRFFFFNLIINIIILFLFLLRGAQNPVLLKGWLSSTAECFSGIRTYASKLQAYIGELIHLLRECQLHTPSFAFWHLPPNSASAGYATAVFTSAQAVHRRGQRPLKCLVLIRLWKPHSAPGFRSCVKVEVAVLVSRP